MAAAGERPSPANEVATVDGSRACVCGIAGAGNDDVRRRDQHLFSGLLRQIGQEEIVDDADYEIPCGGSIAAGDLFADPEERFEVRLGATESLRHPHPEEAGVAYRLEDGLWQALLPLSFVAMGVDDGAKASPPLASQSLLGVSPVMSVLPLAK